MKVPHVLGISMAVILFCPLLASSNLLSELNEAQLAELEKGNEILLRENIEGHPWPKVRLYRKVNAAPREVAAVFFDYEKAQTYVPKLIKSNISQRLSPCVAEVDYGIDVPILPDEFYTVRNTLQSGPGDTYRVDWILLRALQTKASEGNLRIEPFQEGAVLCYTNLVTPSSRMAGILRGTAIEQMRNSVRALVSQVETQKNSRPGELQEEVETLERALNAGGK